jgi:hypothetical protein
MEDTKPAHAAQGAVCLAGSLVCEAEIGAGKLPALVFMLLEPSTESVHTNLQNTLNNIQS